MIRKDRAVIWQFLGKNEDNGTSEQLRIRAQRTVDQAQPKVKFVDFLTNNHPHMKRMLAEVLPIREHDNVRFWISVR